MEQYDEIFELLEKLKEEESEKNFPSEERILLLDEIVDIVFRYEGLQD